MSWTVTIGGRSKVITQEDCLWLARALTGEAGDDAQDAHACASVLLRRWAQRGGASFTLHIRAFSQPVNPRWAAGGDLARANPSHATPEQLERRARTSALRWDQTSQAARSAIARVLANDLALRGAVDWGAPSLYLPHGLDVSSESARLRTAHVAVARREGARGRPAPQYEHLAGARPRGNVFSSDATSRQAGEPVVSVEGSAPSSGGGGALIAAGVLLAGLVFA